MTVHTASGLRVSHHDSKGRHMRNIIYLIGLVVVVLFILSFLGLR